MEQKDNSQPITVTFPSGKIASKIVDIVVRKRPIGWSRKSYSSYYKENYGLWMKAIFDDILAKGGDRFFPYANFPHTSKTSLYLRINMATKYVLDELDPDGVYRKLDEGLRTDKASNPKGIILRFVSVTDITGQAEYVVPANEKPKWLEKMYEWLEDTESEAPYIKEGLMLTNDEVVGIKNELEGLGNIMFTVNNRCIKIIKQ